MRIGPVIARLEGLEKALAAGLRAAAERHRDEHDVYHQCMTFAVKADERARRLEPTARRYRGAPEWSTAVGHECDGDLLGDLRVLYLRCHESAIVWIMAVQAAEAARDSELLALASACHAEAEAHAKWFSTRIKAAAPQALVVA